MLSWQFIMFTLGALLIGCAITFVSAFIWYKQRRKALTIMDEVEAIISSNANAKLFEKCINDYQNTAIHTVVTMELPNRDIIVESGYNVSETKAHEMLRNAAAGTIKHGT